MSRREDIDNAIWGDPEFEMLSANAALLYLWSFTNTRCGMAGIYRVSLRAMAESKVPDDQLGAALTELADAGFAYYEDSVLWVRTRVKHLRTKTIPIAKSIRNDVAKIPVDHPIRGRFLVMYGNDPWLRDTLRATVAHTSTEGHESTHSVGESLNLNGTSPEVQGKGQGKGKGRTTANDEGGQGSARRIDQSALPADFPADLEPRAQEVLGVLTGVHQERGGNEPTLRSVGLSMRRFPKRDHCGVARELEHWTLAGGGQGRPLKDIGRLYATFLERAPEASPMRTATPSSGVETSAQYLARRGVK